RIKTQWNRLWHIIILFIFFLSVSNIVYKSSISNSIQSNNCSLFCPYSSTLSNDTLQFDSSHFIRHFPDFVCPQNFRNLADWIYGWPDQFNEHLERTTDQGTQIAPCLPSGSIIYVRIWAIDEFFDKIYPYLQNKFVLVTGEGDLSSPIHMEILENPDSKIIHWFGQNGQYDVSRSKKFTHIPIGINCFEMADAIQSVYVQQRNHTLPSIFNELDEPAKYIQPQDVSHRAVSTNKNQLNYSFVKCIGKPGGVQIQELPKFYERNRQYPFWLSPREISEKKLSQKNVYQYEKLRNAYWRRLILKKSRHRNKKSTYLRRKRCWSAKSTVNWRQFLPY
ncbi:unnamed protein product, partial [Rotaria sp. Silwood2]